MHRASSVLLPVATLLAMACGGSGKGPAGGDGGGFAEPPQTSCEAPSDEGPLFYVTASGDDDSGDGSEGSPWGTIAHAIENISDGSTVLVGPGTYVGRIRMDTQFAQGVVVRSEPAYQAKLRNNDAVITVYEGQGITVSGFDIAHDGPGAGALVVHIQDLIGESGGADAVSRITLRNNIIHDSYNNDILKINNGAKDILVERNIFYNQEGTDEHIDINSVADVTIQDNLFFNDFAASGRTSNGETSSFIVIKDSNGNDDSYEGSERIAIRRNVFANYQGSAGANFVLVGEDGNPYHEAVDVLFENNLLVGNSDSEVRAPFGIKGGRDIVFRHNTVVGNMPGAAFAFRFNQEGDNPTNQNVSLYNNIWSDPTGSMDDFSDTPPGETVGFTLDNNLYFNGGSAIPSSADDLINRNDDAAGVEGDPLLADSGGVMPTWSETDGRFADGSGDICLAFERMVQRYGVPASGSPAVGAARVDQSPATDILGKSRSGATTIGAVEP